MIRITFICCESFPYYSQHNISAAALCILDGLRLKCYNIIALLSSFRKGTRTHTRHWNKWICFSKLLKYGPEDRSCNLLFGNYTKYLSHAELAYPLQKW